MFVPSTPSLSTTVIAPRDRTCTPVPLSFIRLIGYISADAVTQVPFVLAAQAASPGRQGSFPAAPGVRSA